MDDFNFESTQFKHRDNNNENLKHKIHNINDDDIDVSYFLVFYFALFCSSV